MQENVALQSPTCGFMASLIITQEEQELPACCSSAALMPHSSHTVMRLMTPFVYILVSYGARDNAWVTLGLYVQARVRALGTLLNVYCPC